jgi:hypothetical protein
MSLTTPYREQFLEADGKTVKFPYNDHGDGFIAISKDYVKCEVYNPDGTVIIPQIEVNTSAQSVKIVSLKTPDGKILNAPQAGAIVRIYRDVPETQNATVQALQQSTAQQIINNFDNIVGMIQELQYSDKHFTVRTSLPQRDISLQLLTEADDKKLISWDNEKRKLVVTDFSSDKVVISDNVRQIKEENGNFYYYAGGKWNLLINEKLFTATKDDLQAQITANKANIASNRASIIENQSDISELQGQTVDLYSKHTSLKNRVDRHDEDLTDLEKSVDGLYATKIDKNQGKINIGKVLTVGGDGMVVPRVPQGGGSGIGVVAHDNTLIGAGTDEYPLGVKDKVTITIEDWE